MIRVRDHLPSPSMIVALAALTIALSGTAYAVSHINGRLIAVRSIPANRLQPHSVGATQINKSSLGTVNAAKSALVAGNASTLGGVAASGFLGAGATAVNSAKLDGVEASTFAQGPAHSYSGAAEVPVSESPSSCGEAAAHTRILEVPGYGYEDAYCANYNFGVPICDFEFHDTSGATLSGSQETLVGGEEITPGIYLENLEVASGESITGGSNANIVIQHWRATAGSSAVHLAAEISQSHPQKHATSCHEIAEITVFGS